ncbi:hypothetical protein ACHAQE_010943 [Botrytis cinerea]
MSHHISSFFKSAAGVAENVWENAANNLSNSPKRHRDRRVTVGQAGNQPIQQPQQAKKAQQPQPRRLFPAVRPAAVPVASAQPIGLGLGMELSDQSQSSIPRGVENQNPNPNSKTSVMVDSTPTEKSTSATTTPSNITSTSALTKTFSKNTQRSANSKETSTSKSGNSYNPLMTTSSTYTNPSENLPPTPNLRAVDELGRFADTFAKVGVGAIGDEDSGGEESGGGSASQSQSQGDEISPVDGLSMFGPSAGLVVGFGGAVTHERSERQGSINMQTPTATASGSRVHTYRGVDHGPVAIPGSGSASGSASGFNTPRLIAAGISTTGLGTSGVSTQRRERAFTIPRKPVPMTIVVGNTGFEVVPYGRPIEEISTGACIVNRQECMDWKEEFGGQVEDEGEDEGGEEEEVAGENEEERKERLEKERKEREKRDLLHENPLLSHPIEPTTIATGTPPTVSPIYIVATSLNSKRRGFRRSWTAPINGFNFTSLGGIGVMGFGNTNQDASMHGGLGDAGMGMAMGQRGSARDRYSGNSSEGIGMGPRRGSFLRRASVSFKGMGMGMQEFLRSASGGGSSVFAGAGAVAGPGGMDHTGEGRNSGIERPATMQSEYRGVGGYAGDEAMSIARERIAEAETQRRRSHRESMILPKFEWEEEFTSADDEDDA